MIVNLTQHEPSAEQKAEGLWPSLALAKAELTFETLPSRPEIEDRAGALAALALDMQRNAAHAAGYAEREAGGDYNDAYTRALHENARVLIGGAPYLMGPLEAALRRNGLQPVYSFSERVSQEETQADGSVRKVNSFRHVGFVVA